MGKHRKPELPPADFDADMTAMERLDRTSEHLMLLQAGYEATAKREHCGACGSIASPVLARESAGVGRAVATVNAEIRQQDKHDDERDQRLPSEEEDLIALAWLEDMAPDRLAKFAKRVAELAKKSTHLLAQ